MKLAAIIALFLLLSNFTGIQAHFKGENQSSIGGDIVWLSEKHEYKISPPKNGVGLINGSIRVMGKNIVMKTPSTYDLLIITPSKFYRIFNKLAEYKEKHGIRTKIATLDEINYMDGRDMAEKIKYFIKYAIEQWGIKYVLLGGSIYDLPIRYVVYHERRGYRIVDYSLPTDLYYADVYRYENGSIVFSSWDTNGNGKYGEVFYGCKGKNDTIDLYPDVYVGRLACRSRKEAKIVVNKIIGYEEMRNGKWFKRFLLVGGDTFPGWGVVEGEFMNEYVANMMEDFQPVKMWASDGSISPINVEINMEKGGGFLYYSGHGFPYGWATHKPDDENWTGRYFTPYIAGLFNGYRLPIIFFDACLTAKLDFNTSDLMLPFNITLPCFAWYFVAHAGGGAIATIGATRVAFTGVGENGPFAGASYLAYNFFLEYKSRSNGDVFLGDVFGGAQIRYLNHLWDRWTIQEFILLGDPSLMI